MVKQRRSGERYVTFPVLQPSLLWLQVTGVVWLAVLEVIGIAGFAGGSEVGWLNDRWWKWVAGLLGIKAENVQDPTLKLCSEFYYSRSWDWIE